MQPSLGYLDRVVLNLWVISSNLPGIRDMIGKKGIGVVVVVLDQVCLSAPRACSLRQHRREHEAVHSMHRLITQL